MEEKKEEKIIETTGEVEKEESANTNPVPIIEEKEETVNTNTPETDKKGISIASLVLGIVSIACCFNWFISIGCGVLAIVFGVMGKKGNSKGMAKAGFILGIIGISLWAFVVLLCGAIIGLGTATFLSVL